MKDLTGIGSPRTKLAYLTLFFSLLFVEGCSVKAVDVATPFLPFKQFMQITQEAGLDDFSDLKETRVSDPAEFARMKKHILTMYEGVKVKHSFRLDETNYVDCVDVYTQPGLNKGGKKLTLQKPPPAIDLEIDENTAQAKTISNMLIRGKKDAHGNNMFCEEGYIPMRRITLNEMVRFPTIEDYFNKYGVRGTKGDPTPYKE